MTRLAIRASSCIGSLALAALLLLVGLPSSPFVGARPGSAQSVSCDPALEQPATNPLGYRLRGNRCEGVYAQPVAGTALLVASFTASFEEYDPRAVTGLDIGWTAPASDDIRIRALALRRRTYYRMDVTRPAASGSWTWPVDVLAAVDIPRSELGMVAWTRLPVGGADRDVHLPLRIGSGHAADTASAYSLVLVPGAALTEVWVSVARVGSDGRAGTFIRDEEPLGYNYYPAERPIDIPIARPQTPGIYYVLIGAGIRDGGSLATEFWFHVPQG